MRNLDNHLENSSKWARRLALLGALTASATTNTASAEPAALTCEDQLDQCQHPEPTPDNSGNTRAGAKFRELLGETQGRAEQPEDPKEETPNTSTIVVEDEKVEVGPVEIVVEPGPTPGELAKAARDGAADALEERDEEKDKESIGKFVLSPQLGFNGAVARSKNATPSWNALAGASIGYSPKQWGQHGVEFAGMVGAKRANMNYNPMNHRPKPVGYFELGAFGQYRDGAPFQLYWKAGLNYATGGTAPGFYADGGVVLQFTDKVGLLAGGGVNLINYGPASVLQGDVENVEGTDRSIITFNLRGRLALVLRWDVYNKKGREARKKREQEEQRAD